VTWNAAAAAATASASAVHPWRHICGEDLALQILHTVHSTILTLGTYVK